MARGCVCRKQGSASLSSGNIFTDLVYLNRADNSPEAVYVVKLFHLQMEQATVAINQRSQAGGDV